MNIDKQKADLLNKIEELGKLVKIKGFEFYYISRDGYVFNIRTKKKRKHNTDRYGYSRITLKEGNITKALFIHRLIANAFIPNPEKKATVNHINGIKTDNRVENLEWNTYSENNKHAYKTGLVPKNKKRPSGITNDDVLQIRRLYKIGVSQSALSKQYNTSQPTINRMCSLNFKF